MTTKLRTSWAILLFIFSTISLISQPNYTANNRVTPYNGAFRSGMNVGYYPPWDNDNLAEIAAGNPEQHILGVGSKAFRPGMYEWILDYFGYDGNIRSFELYKKLGMTELTGILGVPTAAHRDNTQYCAGKPSEIFANLYQPIWKNGKVNEENYFAAYVYKLATTYKGQVRFWEVWNEPGFDYANVGWRGPGDPAGNWWDRNPNPCEYKLQAPIFNYIRILRISWEVIKSVDPDAYVVGSSFGFQSFLDAVLRNTDNPDGGKSTAEYPLGGGAYFDCISYHAYPHFDGGTIENGANTRNSDVAARGVLTKKRYFEQILENYGYGRNFPQKEWIVTEINVPRKQAGQNLGSVVAQRNFIPKAYILSALNGIRHLYWYNLGDEKPENQATDEFQSMGFYKSLEGMQPYNVVFNDAGYAHKTTTDFLHGATYDAQRTTALNLPNGVKGYAFKQQDGKFVYVLWAETKTDFSETANANYNFPNSLGFNTLYRYEWNFSKTRQSSTTSILGIALTGSPSFFTDSPVNTNITNATGAPDMAISVTSSSARYNQFKNMSFTVKAENRGNSDLQNANIRLNFDDAKWTLSGNLAEIGTYNSVSKLWTIPNALRGTSNTLTLTLAPKVNQGDISVSATLENTQPTDDNAANNTAGATVTPPGSYPKNQGSVDLEVINVAISPKQPDYEPNETISISYNYKNTGDGTIATAFQDALELVKSDGSSTRFLRNINQPIGLTGNARAEYGSEQYAVTLPNDLSDGTYQLRITLDNTNNVGETNENNNKGAFSFNVKRTNKQLLRVVGVSGASTASVGSTVTLSVIVKNDAGFPSQPDQIAIFQAVEPYCFSAPCSILQQQITNNTVQVPAIPSGGQVTVSATFTVSDVWNDGTPFGSLKHYGATSVAIVSQKDKGFLYDLKPILPTADLELTFSTNTPTYGADGKFQYRLTIKNKGAGVARDIRTILAYGNPPYLFNLPSKTTTLSNSRVENKYVSNWNSTVPTWIIEALQVGESTYVDIEMDLLSLLPAGFDVPEFYSVKPAIKSAFIKDPVFSNDNLEFVFRKKLNIGVTNPPNPNPTPTGNLELTVTADPATYLQWQPVTFKVIVKNNTNTAQSSIFKIDYPVDDLAFVMHKVVGGDYNYVSSNMTITNLAAGASATLDLTLFTRVKDKNLTLTAQQTSGGTLSKAVTITPIGSGTPTPTPSNGTYELNFTANPTTYNQWQPITYQVVLKNVSNATQNPTISLPFMSDDLAFTSSRASAGNYNFISGDWAIGTLAQGAAVTLDLTLFTRVKDKNLTLTATVKGNGLNKSVTITPASGVIAPPTTPTNPNPTTTGVDLEVKLVATPANFDIYKNVIFRTTVTNRGQQTASDVKITLKTPKDLVFTDVKTASGKFTWYFKTWDVGTLAGGATATLDLTLFTLATAPQKVFAQVTNETQKDFDSTPNNNSTDNPVEDDEAAVTITSLAARSGEAARNISMKAYPSPTIDYLNIEIMANMAENADLFVYNISGELVMRRAITLQLGENMQTLDVTSLSEGVYMVAIYKASGGLQWVKFER
jgi:Domain of unknown function DUF11/Secretion system C-terminal sorting domain/CARDB